MLQEVLAITAAVLHLAYDADEFGMQAMHAEVDSGALACLYDFLLNLLLHLGHHLFDACGMDSAIGHKLVHGQSAYLAAHGVKGANDNGLGRVINHYLHSGGSLQGADVTSLTADDATLHLIVVDVEHGHAVLHSSFSGNALYGLDDDTLGFLVRRHLSVIHYLIDVSLGVGLCLVPKSLHQALLRLLGTDTGYLFQLGAFLLQQVVLALIQLLLTLLQECLLGLHALAQRLGLLLAACELVLLLVERELTLLGTVLGLLYLLVALTHLLLQFGLLAEELVLHFEQLLLLDDFRFLLGGLLGFPR